MPEEELRRGLSRLQADEFLYETSIFPDLEYTFKHALTYQVAYNSLLVERRRTLHAKILDAIEGLYGDRLAEQVDWLAHHAFRGEVWAKAVEYLHQAGAKAAARSAYREAIAYFEQALSALGHLSESRETLEKAIAIRIDLGPVLMAIKGFHDPEVESSYNSARELCERFGETPQLFPVLWGLWVVNNSQGRFQTSRELGEHLLVVAEREQDTSLLLQAHHAQWTTLFSLGEFAPAQAHLEQGFTLYDPQQHRHHAFLYGGHDPGVCCRSIAARSLWLLGYPDQAITKARDGMKLAQELSHPFSLCNALSTIAWVHQQRGERQATQERAETLMTFATEQGLPRFKMSGAVMHGWLLVQQGQWEEGISQIRQGAARGGRDEIYNGAVLAEAHGKAGQIEKGLDAVTEALAKAHKTGFSYYEPELHRVKGELLIQSGGQGPESRVRKEAEECFCRAIGMAKNQSAKSIELRAVMSLSRLWQGQGKKAEARKMLVDIYGWFTEGFDTADLKEAKALLEELS
jgi:predicted ATPase